MRLAETLIARFGSELLRHARAHADHRARAIILESAQWVAAARHARARDCRSCRRTGSPLVQAGLFDSRAMKQKWAADEHRKATRTESEARAHLLEADSSVRLAHDPELVMLLIRCSQA